MGLVELFVLAVGLSMDAFAVSVCKGLAVQKAGVEECCIAGVWFGGFQALMPLLGYLLGSQFKDYITCVDHWIAFVLLLIIGVNMIREALGKEEDGEVCPKEENPFAFKTMLMLAVAPDLSARRLCVLAIATSIDALAVGITLAFLNVALIPSVTFIGVTTFVISAIGIRIGNIFGMKYKSRAEFAGGVILICIGLKILLEHLGILG